MLTFWWCPRIHVGASLRVLALYRSLCTCCGVLWCALLYRMRASEVKISPSHHAVMRRPPLFHRSHGHGSELHPIHKLFTITTARCGVEGGEAIGRHASVLASVRGLTNRPRTMGRIDSIFTSSASSLTILTTSTSPPHTHRLVSIAPTERVRSAPSRPAMAAR